MHHPIAAAMQLPMLAPSRFPGPPGLEHAVLVDAALMRKCVGAHNGLQTIAETAGHWSELQVHATCPVNALAPTTACRHAV